MKTYLQTTLCAVMLITAMLFSQCKKAKSPEPLNINLTSQPLSVIQSNIKGNWKLQYGKGGICSVCVSDWRNADNFWDLMENNHVKITYNGKLQIDTTMVWNYDTKMSPSTYVMVLGSRGPQYIVDGIVNDTLVMHDAYVVDFMHYYFTKRN